MKLSDYKVYELSNDEKMYEYSKYDDIDKRGLTRLLFDSNRFSFRKGCLLKRVDTRHRKDIIHQFLYVHGYGQQYEYDTNMKSIADEHYGFPIPFSKEYLNHRGKTKLSDHVIFKSFYVHGLRDITAAQAGAYKTVIRNPFKLDKNQFRKLLKKKRGLSQ